MSPQLPRCVRRILAPTDPTSMCFRSGIPSEQIVFAARDLDADLIVVSTHNQHWYTHLIGKSDTEKLLRHTPCPGWLSDRMKFQHHVSLSICSRRACKPSLAAAKGLLRVAPSVIFHGDCCRHRPNSPLRRWNLSSDGKMISSFSLLCAGLPSMSQTDAKCAQRHYYRAQSEAPQYARPAVREMLEPPYHLAVAIATLISGFRAFATILANSRR